MFYTIYKTTNKINGKYYIGKHQTTNLSDGYMGSGKLLICAIKKYGIENFTKEILGIYDNEVDMNAAEKELVVISEETYNLCEGGKGGFNYINKKTNTAERNRKISSARNYNDPVFKKNLKESLLKAIPLRKKPTYTEEGWNKIISSFKGKSHTEETKRKIGEKNSKQIGKNNSQFGTCWIFNDIENKKISKDELDFYLQLGYSKGRNMNINKVII